MRRYPGPIAFSTEQEKLFFGRDEDIKHLSELIFVERKVLLYSKSGYGKTSLLNAGVEPNLKNNNNFEFIKIRFFVCDESTSNVTPNDRFLMTVRQHADFAHSESQKTIIDHYAKDFHDEYWSMFKKNQLAGNDSKTYILVFDQFEELFSYPAEQINEFKNRLADILIVNRQPRFFINFEKEIFRDESTIYKAQIDQLYQPVNIKVVFAIRSDRLSELNRLTDKIPDIQKVFYELKPLSEEQLRKAIEIPANKPGPYDSTPFTFTTKALDKIITALTLEGTKIVSTTTLQIICQRIEGDFIPKEDGEKEYILKNNTDDVIEPEELPDFKDIFLDFYNKSVAKVKTDTPEKVRKFIEDELIRDGKRVSLDEALCKNISKETLETLFETKLINRERNSVDAFSYELSHDTLIPPIKEMAEKRHKLEEDERLEANRQKELRIAKENAEKERKEREKEAERQAELLDLQKAKTLQAERAARLAEENYENQQKAARKQKKLLWLVILVAVIAVFWAGFGILMMKEANKNLTDAKINLVKFLETDANKLYSEKEFSTAMLRYKKLLKYTHNPDSIRKQISLCIRYENLKKLFYPKYSLAYRLTNDPTLDNLISADSLIVLMEKLNYVPEKNKLEALKTEHAEKVKITIDDNKDRVKKFMEVPDKYLYPEAKKLLLKIQKLDMKDQEIIGLLKQVQ